MKDCIKELRFDDKQVIFQHVMVILQEPDGVQDDVVEVQRPGLPQAFFVLGIQLGDFLRWPGGMKISAWWGTTTSPSTASVEPPSRTSSPSRTSTRAAVPSAWSIQLGDFLQPEVAGGIALPGEIRRQLELILGPGNCGQHRAGGELPWTIIAITFTNKAAGELKARLEKMLGPSARDVWASTFHSACVRILRRDIGGARWSCPTPPPPAAAGDLRWPAPPFAAPG